MAVPISNRMTLALKLEVKILQPCTKATFANSFDCDSLYDLNLQFTTDWFSWQDGE